MHLRTHAKPSSVSQAGPNQRIYHDVMIDHDKNVGTVRAKLDELGITDNTIVLYTTDNGPHANSWPDGATTPFRREKDTNWEGAFRVPAMIRWPGKIKPGSVSIEIISRDGLVPHLPRRRRCSRHQGQAGGRLRGGWQDVKVHLDGYNQLPLTG